MKTKMKRIILLTLLALCSLPACLFSQVTTSGTDFWVSFGSNNNRVIGSINLQVRIVASKTTDVTFTFTETSTSNTVNVPAGTVYTRVLTADEKASVYTTTTTTSNKSLRIQSTEPVSAYTLNLSSATTDATNLLPVNNLGTDYYHMSYAAMNTAGQDGYTVIATEDNTEIYEGNVLKATLQTGGVYANYRNGDATGIHITSNHPIAYFVTNGCVQVPVGTTACDCLYQQMVPVNAWGNTFLVPVTRRGRERVRVLASQDGTVITQTGGTIKLDNGGYSQNSLALNAGQFVELETTLTGGGCYIYSDKPIAVCTYLIGTSYAGGLTVSNGDPALAWVPPIEQSVSSALVAPFVAASNTNLNEHHALIVTPTTTRDQTIMSIGTNPSTSLTGGTWTVGNGSGSDYSFYSIPLTNPAGSYFFANPSGLTVMGYGLGSAESYYYLSGAASRNLDAAFYVDDVHYQDMDGETICDPHLFDFKAVIQYALSSTPGYLKWYINNVEELSARDQLTWTKYLGRGDYTIKMVVLDLNGEPRELITSFTVGCLDLSDDTQTVQEFRTVEIDVLGNDNLPGSLFLPPFNLLDSVITPPAAGTLTVTGSGSNSKLSYLSNGASGLSDNIDSFTYQLTFWNPGLIDFQTLQATAYIYVLQDKGSATACYDTDHTASLVVNPAGTTFKWYNSLNESLIATSPSKTVRLTADTTFLIQPNVPDATAPYNLAGGFPKGRFTIHVANTSTSAGKMRWTGLVDNNWNNPTNWVEVRTDGRQTFEAPVYWAPTVCVDVVIPSDAIRFPELTDSAYCNNILMKDRALLKNPHVLRYDSASVEIKLKPAERDRFIMWSAPLKSMYSGDYHFKKGITPQWGDVNMNLFQQPNPDGGTTAPYTFTATFGQPDKALPLGTPFNLRVTTTNESKDKPFVFPQKESSYTDNATPVHTYPLTRTDGARFITNDYHPAGLSGTFPLPVVDDAAMSLVQVVNPYLAYLDFSQFRSGNSAINNGYYIWDGDINSGFTAISTSGNRYTISSAPEAFSITSPNIIPPLQSFVVVKSASGKLNTLNMSPGWTTTNSSTPYTLRAAQVLKGGILRIKASQGNKTGYAVLAYDPNASPAFGKEDMPAVIFDEIPLTLYSFASGHEPLSINISSDFKSQDTDLGLRILQPGEVKLSFEELPTFGHDVVLIDKQLGNKETNLKTTPEYIFTATKAGELNDRFTLRMQYTGQGIVTGNEVAGNQALQVSSEDGYIYVSTNTGIISNLQIYSVPGNQLFGSNQAAGQFKVRIGASQLCIVKAQIGNESIVEKILVK
ncbi:hypothetical protein FACS189411_15680 [Bacteroidia bacterium]|nr:hypothetical protein FACS189411_15680 [Bacteroidia bacterium]